MSLLPLDILFQNDRLIAVDKPSGLLSVPGKAADMQDSVYSRARGLFPDATGPLIVHRLDWETSGIILLAMNPDAHRRLGRQFEKRTIKKTYVAVLSGVPEGDEGEITLPIRPDWNRRPYQIVDYETGKEAITTWRTLAIENHAGVPRARVEFKPRTGRTHQLRIHAALGLHLPILGDGLYGDKSSAPRLLLHATSIEFSDPVADNSVRLRVDSPVPF